MIPSVEVVKMRDYVSGIRFSIQMLFAQNYRLSNQSYLFEQNLIYFQSKHTESVKCSRPSP